MNTLRLGSLTLVALTAFAGNSVLCRLALKDTAIDAASFTAVRMASGALVLLMLVCLRRGAAGPGRERAGMQGRAMGGDWMSGLVLALYACTFSFAYISLPAGAGALLLFGAVQITMILTGWWAGERPSLRQGAGLSLAVAGMVAMVLPGLSAPPLAGALLMLSSGIAWGAYSLLGRRALDPVGATAGNFFRAAPLSCFLAAGLAAQARLDPLGVLYAALSGIFASGLGYVVWYAALPSLSATRAASVQLAVPVLAALGGTLFMGESITLRLAVSCAAILGGIALVVLDGRRA
ncbi:MAG: DMT family transporter [Noviherbaspirillum sp.]